MRRGGEKTMKKIIKTRKKEAEYGNDEDEAKKKKNLKKIN